MPAFRTRSDADSVFFNSSTENEQDIMMNDDRDSVHNSDALGRERENEEVKAIEQAFAAETTRVRILRVLVALTFLATATAVVVRTYQGLAAEEDENFEDAVRLRSRSHSGFFGTFRLGDASDNFLLHSCVSSPSSL